MRKKLFAVIMSVMMMVTFMPAMAFAAWTDGDYSCKVTNWYDYSKAQVEYSKTGDTYTKDIVTVRNASVDNATNPTKFNGYVEARVKGYNDASAQAKYYDLDNAAVSGLEDKLLGNGRITLQKAKEIFGDEFQNEADVTEVTFMIAHHS